MQKVFQKTFKPTPDNDFSDSTCGGYKDFRSTEYAVCHLRERLRE